MIDVKMNTGSDPMGSRGSIGWKASYSLNPPRRVTHTDYLCPLCNTTPSVIFSEPSISSADPLAQHKSIGVKCKCYGQSQVYDAYGHIDEAGAVKRLVDNFRSELDVRMERAGTPPKGVSLRDWVVEMGKYFGARNQLPPRTTDLSETEKLFIWEEVRG